jgi:hypothetical protein
MSNPCGDDVFMQRRLLIFFAAVRKEGDPWDWTFSLITRDDGLWTEARFIRHGLPVNWICLIEAHAACPYQMKCATGFFAAHRTVNPRKAALNIVRESQALVADVRIEFAGRRREQQ